MDYLPLFLELRGRLVLVVGGGEIALRKARLLARAGARLRVVAPIISPDLSTLSKTAGPIEFRHRAYQATDLDDVWLVVAATGDTPLNQQISAAATARRIFCNAVDDPGHCTSLFPAIIDRAPVQVAISTGGAAPVLARRIRERIESWLPQSLGVFAAAAGKFREVLAHVVPTESARRTFWQRVIDQPGIWEANSEASVTAALTSAVADFDANESDTGEAWLVGAGPGDPGLLTLKAVRALQDADVVLYDRLVNDSILDYARRDATCIFVGKRAGCHALPQEDISDLLVQHVRAGRKVCRLKGGDPFVFGRGGEEVDALEAAGLRWQVIPGITAALGCAAVANIPLTHREHADQVTLMTAHVKSGGITSLGRRLGDRETLVYYMGVRHAGDIARDLIGHGADPRTPVAIVERGTLATSRTISGELATLEQVVERNAIEAPALIYVGAVARQATRRFEPQIQIDAFAQPNRPQAIAANGRV